MELIERLKLTLDLLLKDRGVGCTAELQNIEKALTVTNDLFGEVIRRLDNNEQQLRKLYARTGWNWDGAPEYRQPESNRPTSCI